MSDEDQDLSTPPQTQLYAHDRQADSYSITRSHPVVLHGIISFTPVISRPTDPNSTVGV